MLEENIAQEQHWKIAQKENTHTSTLPHAKILRAFLISYIVDAPPVCTKNMFLIEVYSRTSGSAPTQDYISAY